MTDSRFKGYQDLYGDESWELDALDPAVLVALIEGNIIAYRDDDVWNDEVERENEAKVRLRKAAHHWETISTTLDDFEDVPDEDSEEDDEE